VGAAADEDPGGAGVRTPAGPEAREGRLS
jgi:hypothetical protein